MPRKGAKTYAVTVYTCRECWRRFESLAKITEHQARNGGHYGIAPSIERRKVGQRALRMQMPESREKRERRARRAQSAAQQEEEENDELLF